MVCGGRVCVMVCGGEGVCDVMMCGGRVCVM